MEKKIIICTAKIYQYKRYTFECSQMSGIHKLKRDFEPAKKEGDKFWKMIDEFLSLSAEKQEEYRVRGGCQVL